MSAGFQRLECQLQRLRQEGRVGIIPFLTVGFPNKSMTLELVEALEEAGADALELGIPFSDPLADGSTIQRASFDALKQGVTLEFCLETVAELRQRGVRIPLVLMGYYNPILSYGLKRTARDAAEAGLEGFIVADLPYEESGAFLGACKDAGLALIPLLAPTSSAQRIARACDNAHGFVYCVSVTGVTGARQEMTPDVALLVDEVRNHSSLPIAVGFGISRRDHVEALGSYADAAVVGSALIEVIEKAPEGEALRAASSFVSSLVGVGKPVS